MTKGFLISLMMLIAAQSQALVADRFHCKMEIQDLNTANKAIQEQDFFIGRLPSPMDPSEDFQRTVGQAEMKLQLMTEKGLLTANFNFYYKHALREISGQPKEARQWMCMGLAGGYCSKSMSDKNNLQMCSDSKVTCLEKIGSPFDPNNGWMPSTIIRGIPVFNESVLSPVIAEVKDESGSSKGLIQTSCQFLGSYL